MKQETDSKAEATKKLLYPFYYPFYAARQAIKLHATGGNVLIAATILAMVVANIPAINGYYNEFWTHPVILQIGSFNVFSHGGETMTVLEFINDALMAVFFFSIGLEIKREVMVGELSSFRQALLPIIAACGGMIVPVLIFMTMSRGTDYQGGAAIPMATDIAFSLGVLAILGKRVPLSLKVFLTTLAVVDDIGGIIVIATCYSTHIEILPILISMGLLVLLFLGGVMKIQSKMFYIGVGMVVWYFFLNSGIHSTIAGVLVAFAVPAQPLFDPRKYVRTMRNAISQFTASDYGTLSKKPVLTKRQLDLLKQVESASDKVISPLQDLEDTLHPVVNFIILPLFAFANAGIFLLDMDPMSVFEGVSIAIVLGLVVGKFVGIFSFSWLAILLKLSPKPSGSTWPMIAAVSMLGGIGFTVSIFIANLSFGGNAELLNHAKLGIVVGSIVAGVLGFVFLGLTLPKRRKSTAKASSEESN